MPSVIKSLAQEHTAQWWLLVHRDIRTDNSTAFRHLINHFVLQHSALSTFASVPSLIAVI